MSSAKSANVANNSTTRKRKNAPQQRSELNKRYSWEWKAIPFTDTAIEKLAQEFEDWAEKTDAIYLNRFWLERKMTRDSFENLLERSPRLQSAYKFAKEMIGMNREEKIHKGEADRQTIAWRQPTYSTEVKEVEEWRSRLREGEAKAGASNYTVEMTPVPSSDDVPFKKKDT